MKADQVLGVLAALRAQCIATITTIDAMAAGIEPDPEPAPPPTCEGCGSERVEVIQQKPVLTLRCRDCKGITTRDD